MKLKSLALVLMTIGCSGSKNNRSAGSGPSASDPVVSTARASATPAIQAPTIHNLRVMRIDGSEVPLSTWAGKVLLVVNTASECGYTPQYQGLQQLQARYESRGFAVLGFPSNDFGGQEPGSSEQIATFCSTKYGVTFPMFEKAHVIGDERSPLYTALAAAHGEPQWNFHKYLIDKNGRPVAAWPSAVVPLSDELTGAIERELGRQ